MTVNRIIGRGGFTSAINGEKIVHILEKKLHIPKHVDVNMVGNIWAVARNAIPKLPVTPNLVANTIIPIAILFFVSIN